MVTTAGEHIEMMFRDDTQMCNYAVDLWKLAVQYNADHVYLLDNYQIEIKQIDSSIGERIRKYIPSYSYPKPNTEGLPESAKMLINSQIKHSALTTSRNSESSDIGCGGKIAIGIVVFFLFVLFLWFVVFPNM